MTENNHDWDMTTDEVLIPNTVHFTLENWHCKNCPAHVVHIPGALPPYVSPLYHSECVGGNDVKANEQNTPDAEQPQNTEENKPADVVENPQPEQNPAENQQTVEQHTFPWQQ